jgi:hypothetical protein
MIATSGSPVLPIRVRGDPEAPFVAISPAKSAVRCHTSRSLRRRTLVSSPSDDKVFASVERVVTVLNAINEEHGGIETGERDELCQYIDDVLTDAGIDVAVLSSRHDVERHELTDEWRDW